MHETLFTFLPEVLNFVLVLQAVHTDLCPNLHQVHFLGNPLTVQWLGLKRLHCHDQCSIPDEGTKIPHATWLSQKHKDNK